MRGGGVLWCRQQRTLEHLTHCHQLKLLPSLVLEKRGCQLEYSVLQMHGALGANDVLYGATSMHLRSLVDEDQRLAQLQGGLDLNQTVGTLKVSAADEEQDAAAGLDVLCELLDIVKVVDIEKDFELRHAL